MRGIIVGCNIKTVLGAPSVLYFKKNYFLLSVLFPYLSSFLPQTSAEDIKEKMECFFMNTVLKMCLQQKSFPSILFPFSYISTYSETKGVCKMYTCLLLKLIGISQGSVHSVVLFVVSSNLW